MDKELQKAMLQPVTTVVSNCPLSIHPEASIPEILERFSQQGNHPLIVMNRDGTVAGLITMMDLIQAIMPGTGLRGKHHIGMLDRYLKSTAQTAEDLLSDESLTVKEDATISDALRRMEHTHSSSLIILNEKNVATGCIEMADIIAHLYRSGSR